LTKLLPSPAEIEVRLDAGGEPVHLRWRRWRVGLVAVHNHWRVEEDWWRDEVTRDYYKVQTADGTLCVIYRDRREGKWYLQRIYD
jgi:hypothetical protein